MNPDQIRAKLYKKHGSVLNAFRHFDFDGSSSISFEEFLRHLPTCLGEAISLKKMEELWRAFDPDMSGEIDLKEFVSGKAEAGQHRATENGVAIFKGHAVDPTMQNVTAHA
jgi:Ca2+-binding EF-hand superfamily protein